MKRFLLFVLLAAILTACSAPAAAPVVPTSSSAEAASPLVTDYADATSLRNQLAFGTLKLEGTAQAVTSEQARMLLPFWQATKAMSGDSTTVSAELTAVQNQILAEMKPEQLQTIAAMKITNAQLTAFYAEKGIVMPTPVPGVTKVPGSGKTIPEADRQATRTAAEASGATGSSTGQLTKTLLFDTVINFLTERAAK